MSSDPRREPGRRDVSSGQRSATEPPSKADVEFGEIARAMPLPPWVRRFVDLMDDAIRLPGMERGIGLDAILGALFPALGDALTGLSSVALFVVALRRRVPAPVLLRMALQQLLDAMIGSIPVLGDVFDIFYRANRKNLELIEEYGDGRRKPTASDRALAVLATLLAVVAFALPFVAAFFVGSVVARVFGG